MPEADFAREYQAANDAGAPQELSLETLALTFAENVYAVEHGQGLFHWAAPWLRNKRYEKLDDVRNELGLEQGSLIAPVAFLDPLSGDFRLPANAPEAIRRAYPRGDVPGVRARR
ncbi:MAG: hypothetical protein FJX72_16985 [Armatimonadetes bacterium]|nr:hypothetical protein [Armatimonadota bacterium]